MIDHIQIRGARVHNLKNVDVDVPLNQIVGIAGVSGSGQILAGAGRAVCGRLPAVSGIPVHLYPAAHDAGRAGAGGRGAVCPRRAGAAPAARRAGHPQHLRHGNGAVEQPAADVLPPGQSPLPQRPLSAAHLGGSRRAGACAARNAARSFTPRPRKNWPSIQPGRLSAPAAARARCARWICASLVPDDSPDHRRRGGRPVEHADVVADDRRVPGHGRADRRALPGADGRRKRRSSITARR